VKLINALRGALKFPTKFQLIENEFAYWISICEKQQIGAWYGPIMYPLSFSHLLLKVVGVACSAFKVSRSQKTVATYAKLGSDKRTPIAIHILSAIPSSSYPLCYPCSPAASPAWLALSLSLCVARYVQHLAGNKSNCKRSAYDVACQAWKLSSLQHHSAITRRNSPSQSFKPPPSHIPPPPHPLCHTFPQVLSCSWPRPRCLQRQRNICAVVCQKLL